MFKRISHLSDVQPFVALKKEIRFSRQSNGATLGCYLFMDSKTFDSSEALECRGIAFAEDGQVVSRPLHKFFNLGEKEWLSPQLLNARTDIAAVYEKLDGSMIATAWLDGKLQLRSKKSFASDVVVLAEAYLSQPENRGLLSFCEAVSRQGLTAIFELTHPDARIVVAYPQPGMTLLHVRDNLTGEYVLLNPQHPVHELVAQYKVPRVRQHALGLSELLETLPTLENMEGYVVQFSSGDMVKIKCPWYLRLHRSITFLRERDIALLALHEELDDVKSTLLEAGIDLSGVEQVESRLKGLLLELAGEIDAMYEAGKHLDRKNFAISNKGHPLFGLAMQRYLTGEYDLLDWYARNRLKVDFGLRVLANDALAEALEG